jgi:hypothetical protein
MFRMNKQIRLQAVQRDMFCLAIKYSFVRSFYLSQGSHMLLVVDYL